MVTLFKKFKPSTHKGDVTRDDSRRPFLAQYIVAMLEQCCNYLKQCRNNVAKQCCAKNRRCESSHVTLGSKGGAVVRALASYQSGAGSNPGVDTIRWLSLLLVLSFALRGFSPDTPVFPSPQKPTFPNSNSTRNQVNEEPLCGCATSKWLVFIHLFITVPFGTR